MTEPMTVAPAASAAVRPPRSVAWLLLLAAATAVLLTGLAATAAVLAHLAATPAAVPGGSRFWLGLLAASGLTVASLALRALRWIFLLRRAETRIPIRDAYIGYLAGLSLLLAPFLLGEIAIRAYVHRRRCGVPMVTTAIVNVWERLLDLVALAAIAGAIGIASGRGSATGLALLALAAATMISPVRRLALRGISSAVHALGGAAGHHRRPEPGRLASGPAWLVALGASVAAWLLPGLALWGIASVWGYPYRLADAEEAYAASALAGAAVLAPGGIVIAGRQLLDALGLAGFPEGAAVLSVLAIRFATAGVSTALGCVMLLVHLRTASSGWAVPSEQHFDALAEAYDVQIPEARRHALLAKKTALMRDIIDAHRAGRRGLDVGCGQGWYVARMRELGFDVKGIDASAGQIQLAALNIGAPGLVQVGSALSIPAADATYDFAYIINVVHHLPSVDDQRAAFVEMFRVLRPGGLLFLHEINTRNLLFRFYMGYVFPTINNIDEGVERWLLPNRLAEYTDVPVVDIRHFTFLPEFLPFAVVRLFGPLERWLETSGFAAYSAHYTAVFRKPL
ncbi:MAG: methyltransferase domain-containing protein [Acidobacteriota bacterium]